MLTAQTIRMLRSEAGSALLSEAAALPSDTLIRVMRLRRRYPQETVAAAVELLALRARASVKFSRADEMFFTPEGLEQSSGETVARWRAGRFPPGATVVDLCCGVGGDSISLGSRGPVLSIDRNPTATACVQANAAVYGVWGAVRVACADVARLPLRGDAAFFDPSRRREQRRVRNSAEYQPPLGFVDDILASIADVCVKVSPALDDAVLEGLGGRIEFVSYRGECKEAAVWFGALGPLAGCSATILPGNVSLAADPETPKPGVSRPRAWLYELDPAVVRAHLIWEVAEIIDASQLDDQIAYLTGDMRVVTPFATAYPVLDWMPFNLRKVQARLRVLGRRVVAIKRRGVPLDPMALGPQLTGGGDQPCVVVLTRISGVASAILCGPPAAANGAPSAGSVL
jgi:hypothetical protein